jgi:hypothetical protein
MNTFKLNYSFYFDDDFSVKLGKEYRYFKAYTFASFQFNNRTGEYHLLVSGDPVEFSVSQTSIHAVLAKFPKEFAC